MAKFFELAVGAKWSRASSVPGIRSWTRRPRWRRWRRRRARGRRGGRWRLARRRWSRTAQSAGRWPAPRCATASSTPPTTPPPPASRAHWPSLWSPPSPRGSSSGAPAAGACITHRDTRMLPTHWFAWLPVDVWLVLVFCSSCRCIIYIREKSGLHPPTIAKI